MLKLRAFALHFSFALVCALVWMAFLSGSALYASTPSSTETTLAVSPGTTVPAGTAVTLTATVTAGGAPVTPGLVLFCNAAAVHCVDVNILGQGQLTSDGAARVALRLGIGSHSVKAVFQGTNANAASSSATQQIGITGKLKTQTAIAVSGKTFAARVLSPGSLPATGPVAFGDATNGGKQVAWANLGGATSTLGFAGLYFADLPQTSEPAGLVSGDFNNDGLPDIALARNLNNGTPFQPPTNSLDVYLNNGSGNFTHIATDQTLNIVATGDFNGDGNLDLLDGSLAVHLGDGTGKFAKYSGSVPLSDGAQYASVADFNHDGNPDVAVVHLYAPNPPFSSAAIYLGDGHGGFTLKSEYPVPGSNRSTPAGLIAGNFSGGNNMDLAVALQGNNDIDIEGSVVLLSNDGLGNLQEGPSSPISVPALLTVMAGAEFNGDGITDITVAGGDGLFVLLSSGPGRFLLKQVLGSGTGIISLGVGDFSKDSNADIFAEISTSSTPWTANVLQGDGTGNFLQVLNQPLILPVGGSRSFPSFAIADFDGSGKAGFAGFADEQDVSPQVFSLQVWRNTLVSLSTVQVPNVVVPGKGTHHVFAQYAGDSLHTRSVSPTWSVPGDQNIQRPSRELR